MSLPRREALIRCARDHDALIIADDVYDQLQWSATTTTSSPAAPITTAHLPRLVDIDATLDGGSLRPDSDHFGNAMSNGTFSKICGPGIRVGWAEGTPKFAYGVSQTGTSCSGGAPSQLTSTYVTELLTNGFLPEYIAKTLQPAYAKRYATLVGAVERLLVRPMGVTLPQSDREIVGGYFIWLTLPGGLGCVEFAERCQEEENLVVASGSLFEVPGDGRFGFDHSVRLCYSWEDEGKLVAGVERMARVLDRMLKGTEAAKKYRKQLHTK